jgi:hypothetical protein
MNHKKKNVKLPTILLSAILAGSLMAGCAQTVAPSPNIFQRAQGETPEMGFPGVRPGTLLAESVDKRIGGMAVANAAQIQWGDAQAAMDYRCISRSARSRLERANRQPPRRQLPQRRRRPIGLNRSFT